jgi:predicted ATP-grasp superfamily ATP-dependent carboligase
LHNGDASSLRDRRPLPPAVVLNMHYTGLALARALKAIGLRVIGLSSDPALLGNVSNSIEFRPCPDSERAPEQCVQFLLDLASECGRRPLLLPTRDHDVHMIRRHRLALQASFILPMAENDVLEHVLDKESLYAVAGRLGVACPRSFWIRTPTDLLRALPEIPMPCIAKPVSASDWRKAGIWEAVGRRKAVIFDGPEALQTFYAGICDLEPALSVQEYIPGDDRELVIFGAYFNAASGARAYYTARKLLQLPPLAGTGIAVRCEAVPQIVAPSIALLDHLGYLGPAEIEYKLDRRSGQYKLIEINTRFWDQHALGAACGVDLARAMIDDLVLGRPAQRAADGTSATWIAEDGLLVSLLTGGADPAHSPATHRAAWRGRKVFAVFSWRDPRPALRVAAALAQRFASSAWRALRRRLGAGAGRSDAAAGSA